MEQESLDEFPEPVAVIMPTLASAERADLLRAAVHSVLSQAGVRPHALLVVNGQQRDAGLVRELERMPGVRLISRDAAHLGDALHAGRAAVDTPWFAELDDDDLLLPDALSLRLRHLRAHPEACAVVTNGWAESEGARRATIADFQSTVADPVTALTAANWLSPGGALFRSDAVTAQLFRELPSYLEWTCLALRLTRLGPIEFLDTPTFVYNEASPHALWNSAACVLGLPDAMRRLLESEVCEEQRRGFARRLASACNAAANLERERRRWREAWRWHLRCIASGGWRYLPFTRKLLPGLRDQGEVR